MRKSIYLLFSLALILIVSTLNGQCCYDSFELGYPLNPVIWQNDTGDYKVNSSGQLQLDRMGAGESEIYTRISCFDEMRWSCKVKMSFNTSANNFAKLILFTDTLGQALYLNLGGGDDRLELVWRQNNVDSLMGIGQVLQTSSTVNEFYVDVRRANGNFLIRTSPDSMTWSLELTAGSIVLPDSGFTGLFSKVTSSNSTKVRFDDFIYCKLSPDTLGPTVSSWLFPQRDRIILHLSELLDTSLFSAKDVFCNGISPAMILGTKQLNLVFDSLLPESQSLVLQLPGLCDTNGNCSLDTSFQLYYFKARYGDVQITEIMADPIPTAGLPESEYIELYNRSDFPLSLGGWCLRIDDKKSPLPDFILSPGEFVMIVDSDNSGLWNTQTLLTIPSLTLPNSGAIVSVHCPENRTVHSVEYDEKLWGSSWKAEGGWSIIRKDLSNNEEDHNWALSLSLEGGSPGEENSVKENVIDPGGPEILMIIPENQISFWLIFSSAVDSASLPDLDDWGLSNGFQVVNTVWNSPLYDEIRLDLGFPLQDSRILSLDCPPLKDLNGNLSPNPLNTMLAWPEEPDSGDIIINEILYQPFPGGDEFIELYNTSLKVLSLRNLVIGQLDTVTMQALSNTHVSEENLLVFPGEFRYLASDIERVLDHYPAESIPIGVPVSGFPALSDAGAILFLASTSGKMLDLGRYGPELHHPAIVNTQGVSLERISPRISGINQLNWQSSAQSGPGASPGKTNTMFHPGALLVAETSVKPSVISPDSDGHDDIMLIQCTGVSQEATLSIQIFDMQGRQQINLLDSYLSGQDVSIPWDGTDDYGRLMPSGIYLLVIKVSSSDGVSVYRHPVAIAYP